MSFEPDYDLPNHDHEMPECCSYCGSCARCDRCCPDGEEIWTEEEVKNLQEFQTAGFCHPFTWDWEGISRDLIPTRYGWIVVDDGPIVQKWAHSFMLDGSHVAKVRKLYDELFPKASSSDPTRDKPNK